MTPETAVCTVTYFVFKLSSANTNSSCGFLLAHYTARTGSNSSILSIKQTWQPVSQIVYQVSQEVLSCRCQYPRADAKPITEKPGLLWVSSVSANWNQYNLKEPLLHDVTDNAPRTLVYAPGNKGIQLAVFKRQDKQWVAMLCIGATWIWAEVLILNSSLIILSIGISKTVSLL